MYERDTKVMVRTWGKALAVSLSIWVVLALFLASQAYFNSSSYVNRPPYIDVVQLALLRYLSYGIVTVPVFFAVREWPVNFGRVSVRVLAYCVGFVFFSLAFALVRWVIWPTWDPVQHVWMPRTWQTYVGLLTSVFELFVMYVPILGISHAFEYYRRTRIREMEQSDLQRSLAENELQLLKAQLHPHFLFNTLHGIGTLIDDDPRLAKQLLVGLGDLLRAAIRNEDSELIPLRDELAFVRKYLALEKMRLGDRLEVGFDLSEEAAECLVPQMIMQPLVENAVTHGASSIRNGGWVKIHTAVESNRLLVNVRNKVGSTVQTGSGLGLPNARARLHHLYSGDGQLLFCVQQDNIADARLSVPILKGTRP